MNENEINQENQEEINLNNLFNMIANANELKNYLGSLNCFFSDYSSLCNSHYDSFNELYLKYFVEQNKSIMNTKIYKIESIVKKILKINMNYMKAIELNMELLASIQKQISEFGSIIGELPMKFNNFNFKGQKTEEANKITNSLNKSLTDFETKIVGDYIKERYNKNIAGMNVKDSIDNLVVLIEYLENSLLNITKERKSQYFNELKEPDDKINSASNEINKTLLLYVNKIKEFNKIFEDEIVKLEDEIKSSKNINEEKKKKEELILSKNDFVPSGELNIYKYKIKVLKNVKIPLESLSNSKKPVEKTDNKLRLAKFEDKCIFLTEEDIFNIISKFYSYNFFTIDKSQYDLNIEKGKIDSLNLTTKILSYLNGDKNIQNMLENNYDEIQKKVNHTILNNFENMKEFYLVLNNHRGKGKNKFSKELFDLVVYIFNKTLYFLMQKPDTELADLMLILSQTYFKDEKGKKMYVCDEIKSHELFKRGDFWEEIIIHKIEEEFKLQKKLSHDDIRIKDTTFKKDETISTKLIPLGSIMIDFNMEKNKSIEIVERVIKKYHCSEKTREQIISFLNKYEAT